MNRFLLGQLILASVAFEPSLLGPLPPHSEPPAGPGIPDRSDPPVPEQAP
jgi:hypothetical protein